QLCLRRPSASYSLRSTMPRAFGPGAALRRHRRSAAAALRCVVSADFGGLDDVALRFGARGVAREEGQLVRRRLADDRLGLVEVDDEVVRGHVVVPQGTGEHPDVRTGG